MKHKSFQFVCDQLQLGKVIRNPKKIEGGLFNDIWHVVTELGEYAFKRMNATRNRDKEEYEAIEQFSEFLSARKIPALSAKKTPDKNYVIMVDDRMLLVYPWINGCVKTNNTITKEHASLMGELLAKIHGLKYEVPPAIKEIKPLPSNQRWEILLNRGAEANVSWYPLFKENYELIKYSTTQFYESCERLPKSILSHKDVTPMNVLWIDNKNPWIIDWEWAGETNPTVEFFYVSLLWSGLDENTFDEGKFIAFLNAYCKAGGELNDDMCDGLYGCLGLWLDWLTYNLEHSLVNDNQDEKELRIQEGIKTLNKVVMFVENIERWVKLTEENYRDREFVLSIRCHTAA